MMTSERKNATENEMLDKNIPISTNVPLEFSAPVLLNLGETKITDSLGRLRDGLLSVDSALSAVQTQAFPLDSWL
jgi:hypothetical protein